MTTGRTVHATRHLSVIGLLGFYGFWDPRFSGFGIFGLFAFARSENRWWRAVSQLGWLGFITPLLFLLDWWTTTESFP